MATMYEFLSSRPKSGQPGKLKSDMCNWDQNTIESRDYVLPVRGKNRNIITRLNRHGAVSVEDLDTNVNNKGCKKTRKRDSVQDSDRGSSGLVTQMVTHKYRSKSFTVDENQSVSDGEPEQVVVKDADETKSIGSSCLRPEHSQYIDVGDAEYVKILYEKKCEKCGLVPMGLFNRQVGHDHLDLHFNAIGDLGMKSLAAPISMCPGLISINLNTASIGDDGTKYLMAGLLQKEGIRDLDLSDNKIGRHGGEAICELIKRSKSLRSLNLSGNMLGDIFAKGLARALNDTNLLSELNLMATGLGSDAGKYLGPSLALNDTVSTLNISWNSIRLDGAVAIANGLKKNLGILKLDISWNGFSLEGSEAMGEALIKNNTLTHLDMSNNRIFDKGVFKLMKGLQRNQTLEVLILNTNPISPEGALGLLKSISQNANHCMQRLELQGVPIRKPFLETLSEVNEKCPDFQVFYETGKDATPRKTTMDILFDYLYEKKSSLQDIFGFTGKESELSINKGAFIDQIMDANTPLTDTQALDLAQILTKKDPNKLNLVYLFRRWESYTEEKAGDEKS